MASMRLLMPSQLALALTYGSADAGVSGETRTASSAPTAIATARCVQSRNGDSNEVVYVSLHSLLG